MFMKLPLAYYGNPVLRKKAAKVEKITNEIKQLVQDMAETMEKENGIGLAAPQVHYSLALFVTKVPIKQDDDSWSEGTFRVFINPKITSYSEERDFLSEGCLSIPKIHGDVERPVYITVEAMDQDGNFFTGEFSDLEARCIMHENDHINGTLFIDRMDKEEREEIEPLLKELKKNLSKFKNITE
jgi:peptide deformylase